MAPPPPRRHLSSMTADDWIALLDLEPHPEGGAFAETYREAGEPRGHGTAIYFLLREGEASAWHRVDADEMWHFYAGAPLLLETCGPGDDALTALPLGIDAAAGERPQRLVPKGHWQRARSLGSFTLVGCTVTPAFEFAGFELPGEGFDPRSA